MLEKEHERKSGLKERQLQQKADELELQRRKLDAEADERKEKLKLEMEERMFLNFFKDSLCNSLVIDCYCCCFCNTRARLFKV